MTLPANNTTISAQDINRELGVVGNSSVVSTSMQISLNSASIRSLQPGTGHTIGAVNTQLSMFDLQTAYLREKVGYNSTKITQATNTDSFGNIYVAQSDTTGVLQILKFNAALNTIIWAKDLKFNNANGTSATGFSAASASLYVDLSTNRVIISCFTFFVAKFSIFISCIVVLDTDGNYVSQVSSMLSTASSISGTLKPAAIIGTNNLLISASSPNNSLNRINVSSSAVISNNVLNVALTSNTAVPLIVAVASTIKGQSANAYVVGTCQNAVSSYGFVAQHTNSDVISWGRTCQTGVSGATSAVVDTADNVYVLFQNATTTSPVLAKFNSSGTFLFNRRLAFPSTASITGSNYNITIDTNDNIFVIAGVSSNATVNGAIYIAALNSSGTSLWNRTIRGSLGTTFQTNAQYLAFSTVPSCATTGNRLQIPVRTANSTLVYNSVVSLNANTGSAVGTYTPLILEAPTVTQTANVAGYITFTTAASSLTGNARSFVANVSVTANATVAPFYTFSNIT